MFMLALLFLITALLYASVGFGGGSTYNALLVLHGADYRLLPSIALICNIIVVSGGVWRYGAAGHLSVRKLAPWMAVSVPAAWIGGRIEISEVFFIGILGFSLLAAGIQLFTERTPAETDAANQSHERTLHPLATYIIGGGIGFLSGMVGIGGGIFLAPVLYFLRWDNPKAIAGACSLFILFNSTAGLLGQSAKLDELGELASLSEYWMLFPAVLIGGQIGSHLGSVGLSAKLVKRLTAVLILYVAARLIFRWVQLVI